jgi:heme exporter protein D
VAEFFHMGGHAGFIWTSWGVAIAGLALLGVASWRRSARLVREAEMAKSARRAGRGGAQ